MSIVKGAVSSVISNAVGNIIPTDPLVLPITEGLIAHSAAFQQGIAKTDLVSVDESNFVATWKGISGTVFNGVQPVQTNKPVYSLPGINRLPSVTFGSNDRLDVANFSLPANSDLTIFLVTENSSVSGLSKALLSLGSKTLLRIRRDTLEYETNYGGLKDLSPAGQAVVGEPAALVLRISYSENKVKFYYNQDLVGDVAGVGAESAVTDTLYIGNSASFGRAYIGDIGEFVFYDRALSDIEREQITKNYLFKKWKINLN